ncbi:dihydrolipoyl dehydrogenase family protein [Lapidilactobacillus wuchangensis]|uniref:dihydrolipoyl dehydrogenase family protein n=1 Tax=Lapidilactobacillus wuchangensis TaxID=2486001 RepID=UPI000F7A35D1|nr:NAD(P)/FAD-dependent oxidoreductase [Lapidilactobacillus wuchangensis]
MSEKYDYEVLYLGAGHGTFDGAAPLAATGVSVAVIESGLIGGTCPNRGCNAKIALDEAVKVTRESERLNKILAGQLQINWPENIAHKQEIIQPLPAALSKRMTDAGVTIIKGHAQFKDAHTVIVNGDQEISAEKIVIATGLKPHRLDISGTELAHDSTDFMNLAQLPKHLTIVGSGYISLEFATMANAAGAEVTILMHADQALRKFHQPFVELILADLEKRGVKFIRNAHVQSFTKVGQQYQVTYGQNEQLLTDWILDATGRIPNVDHLGLEQVGVHYDQQGIAVNDHLQTNVPSIYAVGDVIASDQPKVTPSATFESKYLTKLFSGATTEPIQFPVIPTVVFTSPRIAQAGVSVAEAQEKDYQITENNLADYWYYQVDREPLARSIQIHDQQGHLVGVTEISDQAPDVINTLLPAIEFKFDQDQIERLVGLFPTIGYAAWHRA